MTAPDPRAGEIQARLAKATPGPWHLDRDEPGEVPSVVAYAHNDGVTIGTYVADTVEEEGDAEFIAAAPTDVAYLLAELRDRDEKLAKVKAIAESMERIADFNLSVLPSDDMGISLKQHAEDLRAAVAAAGGGGE